VVGEARLEEDSERQAGLLRNKGVYSMYERYSKLFTAQLSLSNTWICKVKVGQWDERCFVQAWALESSLWRELLSVID